MSNTLATRIERQLALEILQGKRPPGSQLPPVRDLAAAHGVTTPTLQRVVDRLEAAGLVSARRGSGVSVLDPQRSADLSLLPLWFEALADQPARAAAMLGDFLELRRIVLVHLVRVHGDRLTGAAAVLAPLVIAARRAATPVALAEADLGIARAIIDTLDQVAIRAIFQATARLVREVPRVTEALYGDADAFHRVVRQLATAIAEEGAAAAPIVERVLVRWDRRSCERYLAADARP